MVLGNIIYPAFLDPYVVQLMPLTGIAAFAAEVAVFGIAYGKSGLRGLSLIVLAANLVSSLAGVVLAFLLPSGLSGEVAGRITHGPAWGQLATVSWLVACLVSVVIEYPVLKLATRKRGLRRLSLTVTVANVASYLVLFGASRLAFG